MYIISIDTSSEDTSCAIVKLANKKLVASNNYAVKQSHAESLFSLVEQACKQANISIADISKYVVASGPGSYTGVRIGLSAVKGLAFAGKKQTVAISKFEAIISSLQEQKKLANSTNNQKANNGKYTVIIDAKRDEVFTQDFVIEDNKIFALDEPKITTYPDLHKIRNQFLALLQDAETFKNIVNLQNIIYLDTISAQDFAIAAINLNKFEENITSKHQASALYIRQPDYVKTEKYKNNI